MSAIHSVSPVSVSESPGYGSSFCVKQVRIQNSIVRRPVWIVAAAVALLVATALSTIVLVHPVFIAISGALCIGKMVALHGLAVKISCDTGMIFLIFIAGVSSTRCSSRVRKFTFSLDEIRGIKALEAKHAFDRDHMGSRNRRAGGGVGGMVRVPEVTDAKRQELIHPSCSIDGMRSILTLPDSDEGIPAIQCDVPAEVLEQARMGQKDNTTHASWEILKQWWSSQAAFSMLTILLALHMNGIFKSLRSYPDQKDLDIVPSYESSAFSNPHDPMIGLTKQNPDPQWRQVRMEDFFVVIKFHDANNATAEIRQKNTKLFLENVNVKKRICRISEIILQAQLRWDGDAEEWQFRRGGTSVSFTTMPAFLERTRWNCIQKVHDVLH